MHNILLNQKDKVFSLDDGVVYYEENNKLLYLNTDVDGNILFFRDYVKDIKPYYYNFRTNSHLKLKYLENVE